jgi:hypothetical protein
MTKATGYLLSDIDDFCPESAENYQSKPDCPAASVIYAPEPKRRRISAVRKRLLDSIVMYLYSRGQKARTAEERDGFTLALALMSAVRRGDSNPLASASFHAFGSTFERYLERRAEQQWRYHSEYVKLIPDYDPQEARRANVVEAAQMGRQTAGRGTLHTMPESPKPAQRKSLRAVSGTPEKIVSG